MMMVIEIFIILHIHKQRNQSPVHMSIEIKEVNSRRMLRTFIHIPEMLHKNYHNWMPTIYADDWKFFDATKNHLFNSCDTVLAVAYMDGKPVGRIMGIIHRIYNDIRSENNARFGYFDSIDDQNVAHALISFIIDWAKKFDKSVLVGPYGFSDKDVQGLLIDGYDKMPLIDSACNPAYIVKLIEKDGFSK